MTDIRSIIHWQPDITTDKNGEATVSFYTADNPASYSIIMEGSDLKGSFGTTRTSIKFRGNLLQRSTSLIY